MPFSPEASYADSFDLSQRTYARRQARRVIMKSY